MSNTKEPVVKNQREKKKKKNRIFFLANEQPSRDAIKCKRVKKRKKKKKTTSYIDDSGIEKGIPAEKKNEGARVAKANSKSNRQHSGNSNSNSLFLSNSGRTH